MLARLITIGEHNLIGVINNYKVLRMRIKSVCCVKYNIFGFNSNVIG